MSDRLDDRIRQLFEEADSAAPEPPPMPALPTSAPIRPARWLVPAVGLAMAVLVLGLVATLVGGGAEDTGDASGTTSPSVTSAADAAAETTAAAADMTAAPETTSAAETTEAMDEGDGPDPVILLGAACSDLIDEARTALTTEPSTAEEYRSVAEYLEPFLSDLVGDIDQVASDTDDPDLQGALQRGETVLDITDTMINEADDDELSNLYTDLRRELEATAVFLEDFGASDCSDLGELLP